MEIDTNLSSYRGYTGSAYKNWVGLANKPSDVIEDTVCLIKRVSKSSGSDAIEIITGTKGNTSFNVANPLNNKTIIYSVYNNNTNKTVMMELLITESTISATGLAPLDADNQYRIVVRK